MIDTGMEMVIDINESTLIASDWYYMVKNGVTGASTPLGYDKLRPQLLKRAKAAKDLERVNYLKRDIKTAVAQLDRIIVNIERVKAGKPEDLKKYKQVKQWVDKGLTVDMIRTHQKFLQGEYMDALNVRAKELKARNKDSVNEAFQNSKMNESVSAGAALAAMVAGTFAGSYVKYRMDKAKQEKETAKKHAKYAEDSIKEALKVKSGNYSNPDVFILPLTVVGCSANDIIKYFDAVAKPNLPSFKRILNRWEDLSYEVNRESEDIEAGLKELKKFKGKKIHYVYAEDGGSIGFYSADDHKIHFITIENKNNPRETYAIDKLMKCENRDEGFKKELEDAYARLKMDEAFSIDLENDDFQTINETMAKRDLFYRLSESEMFQNANRMAKINGEAVVDVLPRMAVEGQGFSHVELSELDPTVIYELFESNRFRITCKRAMRNLLNSGKVVMVYGDTYRIPTCIPYIVASAGNRVTVYVNITPFTGINKYGKIVVNQMRNYSGLMAVLFAACVAHEIAEKTHTLPTELLDALVLFYSGMMTKVINGIVHADSIQKETCRYLCAEFALVQMYGTEYGTTLFQRIKNKYFPKLGNLVINSIDDTFNLDGFDNLTSFVEELKKNYTIMKVLNTSVISERWMKSFGSATALSLDYIGYHLYTLCMLLFESPLVSRMALEPLIDQKKGTEAFKRMQTLIGG
jgi:hypothetical protein|nr:MAG TPA: hypothetical protein [Caudoviricetes sp.]